MGLGVEGERDCSRGTEAEWGKKVLARMTSTHVGCLWVVNRPCCHCTP